MKKITSSLLVREAMSYVREDRQVKIINYKSTHDFLCMNNNYSVIFQGMKKDFFGNQYDEIESYMVHGFDCLQDGTMLVTLCKSNDDLLKEIEAHE